LEPRSSGTPASIAAADELTTDKKHSANKEAHADRASGINGPLCQAKPAEMIDYYRRDHLPCDKRSDQRRGAELMRHKD
jgi:hypothetical protein